MIRAGRRHSRLRSDEGYRVRMAFSQVVEPGKLTLLSRL